MIALLAFESKRAFVNPFFAIALAVGTAIVVCHIFCSVLPESSEQAMYLDAVRHPLNVFNRWIGGWPGSVFPALYFFILPLLAALPHGNTLYSDKKTGYISQVLMRKPSSGHYYAAKYIATFLSGAIVATTPLLLDFYLTSLILPQATPDPSSGMYPIFAYSMWSEIFFSSPYLYVAMYLVLIFVTSGIIACIPLTFSSLLDNKALVTCSGFFLCSIAAYLFGTGDATYLAPTIFLRPDQPSWGYEFWQIAIVLSVSACIEALYLVHLHRHDATN
ncbi:MAG: hypothetical protein Q4B69_00025 [Slackia sp.]|nr:hypothetical protein [Slackia sp.]